MILAAHQPAYMPWLGYLDKMAKCDVFVLMDDLQYEAQNFQNRNRIKVNNGAGWLTVPLKRGPQHDRIMDKFIQNEASEKEHWQRRTWLSLKTHYGKAPYFSRYAEEVEDVYRRPWEKLVELDVHMLELARKWFGISRPVLRASTLGLVGQKTERILDLCQKTGAKAYLSGSGGSTGYFDEKMFADAGIAVMWQHFTHPEYPQRYPQLGFIPYLGFFDLIFNCGPESPSILSGANAPITATFEGNAL